PGYVHHVDDDRHALRLVHFLPAAVLLVLADRHDDRRLGVVDARGNLPLQGPLERPLEVPQRLGAALADARVAVARRDDVLLAARLDARQGQLFAEDGGQFLHCQFDFEDVAAGLVAGAALAVALRRAQRRAGVALAHAHPAGTLLAVAELRDVDLWQGNADQVLALLADHLAAADVLAQVRLNLAAHDLAEALVVAFDLLTHGGLSSAAAF